MKTYHYLIALVILIIVLAVILGFVRPPSAVAPTTASSSPAAMGATSGHTVVIMTPSGNVQAPDTSRKAYVPVVPQSAEASPKMVYTPASTTNDIRVTSPLPGSVVSAAKAIKVSGEARGSWFFEATFPVLLTDASGKVITTGTATAGGNWMTTSFIPFLGNINFIKQPSGSHGFIILKKDNPSGLSQNDESVEIPIVFQ